MTQICILEKMKHFHDAAESGMRTLRYSLAGLELNTVLGQQLSLRFTGRRVCIHCAREVKKLFGEGACFPCFQKKAACDICIVKPELCHYREGTCREPTWGEGHCLIPHLVYLCNTTGLKVGITRAHKKFERWGDQGAIAALELAIVPERYVAGLLEVELAQSIKDKSDWRALLSGDVTEVNLRLERERVRALIPIQYQQYFVSASEFATEHHFNYPMRKYLSKISTHNFDKEAQLSGVLEGVRGQYLFVGNTAVNIRKYSGYEIELSS
jgi:hypothetical protein